LTETPDQIRSELKIGGRNLAKAMKRPTLSAADVRNYRRLHPDLGREERAFLGTQLQARLAAPWTCVVVALIAIPFGVSPERRNLFYGVAGSIGLAFVYFVVQRVGFALGQKGSVEPWLAAWLPNLVFAGIGAGLISRLR
jgi:lipopolysaccharide export system permease protein